VVEGRADEEEPAGAREMRRGSSARLQPARIRLG
jgi:hypothetical protein